MAHRMARRRPVAPSSLPLFQSAPATGLRLHAAGERLSTLLKQRERLLAEVKRKQAELEAASVRASASAQEVAAQMAPFIGKFDELRAEIGALFDELLAPKRLAARARKKVAEVHRSLIAQGLIPARPNSTDVAEESGWDDGAVFEDFDVDAPPFSESPRQE